jgi:hypothetical protein
MKISNEPSMKRCSQGHYYESEKFHICPFCNHLEQESKDLDTWRSGSRPPEVDTEDSTVRLTPKTDIDPVVGWLVCTAGPDKGRDYRIRSEKNFIGRSTTMSIAIQHDMSVSREKHAIVSYDPKNNRFKIHPGEANGLVYLNNDTVDIPTELDIYDVIEIGQTQLMFVPFCGEKFHWEKILQNEPGSSR